MNIKIVLLFTSITALSAFAEKKQDKHSMLTECKSFCPKAKTEHDMHDCMKKVIAEKKGDSSFESSECFHSVKEHEKHEKEHKH